jgi:hypothetical protein
MAKKVGFYSIFIVLIMTQNFHQSSLCAMVENVEHSSFENNFLNRLECVESENFN